MSRLELAISQISQVRKYTLWLLDHTEPDEWFRQPQEGITHIAWQVGHLATSEYRLTLERIRGRKPSDANLISEEFSAPFRRDTVPSADEVDYPSPEELRAVLDGVHAQALHELKRLPKEELDQRPVEPHPFFDTKLGALLWCAQHEMVHAGQIGLLRRLLGHKPLW